MKNPAKKSHTVSPVVRLRPMVMVLLGLALIIVAPLLLVWKQSFISSASMRIESMNDTLSTQNRRIAALRLACERLSSNERIESVGRTALHLEYPSSDRIVLVQIQGPLEKKSVSFGLRRLFAARDIGSGKGGAQ